MTYVYSAVYKRFITTVMCLCCLYKFSLIPSALLQAPYKTLLTTQAYDVSIKKKRKNLEKWKYTSTFQYSNPQIPAKVALKWNVINRKYRKNVKQKCCVTSRKDKCDTLVYSPDVQEFFICSNTVF